MLPFIENKLKQKLIKIFEIRGNHVYYFEGQKMIHYFESRRTRVCYSEVGKTQQ